jgi:hypothetical protein
MADSPRARMEVEAAMRRIHDLSTSEQLKVFLLLRDYLADTLGEETSADKQIRERADALDAMQTVAGVPRPASRRRSQERRLQEGAEGRSARLERDARRRRMGAVPHRREGIPRRARA